VPERAERPIRLSDNQRRLSAVLGVLLIGAGGVAVFVTGNEVGSTALLLLGSLFLLMAVIGIAPKSIGKEGVTFPVSEAAGEALEWRLENSPAEVAEPVAEAIVESTEPESPANRAAHMYLRARKAEQAFFASLRLAAPRDATVETEVREGGRLIDAVVSRGGRTVAVEYVYSTAKAGIDLRVFKVTDSEHELVHRLGSRLGRLAVSETHREQSMLVVAEHDTDVRDALRQQLDDWAQRAGVALLLIDWKKPAAEATNELRQALENLLGSSIETAQVGLVGAV
jgi:hypothetical protein